MCCLWMLLSVGWRSLQLGLVTCHFIDGCFPQEKCFAPSRERANRKGEASADYWWCWWLQRWAPSEAENEQGGEYQEEPWPRKGDLIFCAFLEYDCLLRVLYCWLCYSAGLWNLWSAWQSCCSTRVSGGPRVISQLMSRTTEKYC